MVDADLALVIALDASASVSTEEFGLMAGGVAFGLRDAEVASGLLGGPRAVTVACLLVWSGRGEHETMLDWTELASRAGVDAFADAVENVPRIVRAGATAIGEALLASLGLLGMAPGAARRIIDVAGDGRSNDGIDPAPVRDRLVDAGVTVNGLCVLHEEPDLLEYYQSRVIGGAGAFALPCPDYGAFAEAMRRKLLREIASVAVPEG